MARRSRPIEEDDQIMFVRYLQTQYPGVLFNFDMGGVRLGIGAAIKAKRMGNTKGYPDIFLPEPRNGYHGCYLEIKRTGLKVKKRNGEWKDEHTGNQAIMLERLRNRGYYAEFAIGFDDAKKRVDEYLGLRV